VHEIWALLATALISAVLGGVGYRKWGCGPPEVAAINARLADVLEKYVAEMSTFMAQVREQHATHTQELKDLTAILIRRTDILEHMAEILIRIEERTRPIGSGGR
jgi:DNA mismatch repair ATPase MutS